MKCENCIHGTVCDYSDIQPDEEIVCSGYEEEEEPRTHGEWIPVGKNSNAYSCSICHWLKNYTPPFCENCGAKMQANDRQVTGKLNSEIEKSKSEICPCIVCGKYTYCRLKDCGEYQKWKEGD